MWLLFSESLNIGCGVGQHKKEKEKLKFLPLLDLKLECGDFIVDGKEFLPPQLFNFRDDF
jgi:hypothetical protein